MNSIPGLQNLTQAERGSLNTNPKFREAAGTGGPAAREPECTSGSMSMSDIIRYAEEHPPEPIIDGLLNVGETLVLHGLEESYKSVFVLQMAESASMGRPLLGQWSAPREWRVGVLETEMNPAWLGQRLKKMFPTGELPTNWVFMGPDLVQDWRRDRLDHKFATLEKWIEKYDIDVLFIDTANDFFRGRHNPSDERIVGEFFDRIRALPVAAHVLVRHDRKKKERDSAANSNELIRGSAEWKEDPETILYLKREDKRTHEARLEIGKLRYGRKPEPMRLWFDTQNFRLTPLPPVLAVLQPGPKTREELLSECEQRFGIGQRMADGAIESLRQVLMEGQEGHRRTFRIDRDRVAGSQWSRLLDPGAPAAGEAAQ